jgi:SAM-dependent methyltransferase
MWKWKVEAFSRSFTYERTISMSTFSQDAEQLRAAIRERYTQTLQSSGGCCGGSASSESSCCGTDCCSTTESGVVTGDLYSETELSSLPVAAVLASRGCGNPTALIDLKEGERVLDLGSGGGIDVLLSARRVGPTGFAYGLDMTDAMLELAERNRVEAGVDNVRFLKGVIEDIPLPDNAVDVVISNCVINLSADKGRVLREAHRVLAPGGRFAVSDIVYQGQFPEVIRSDLDAWAGCIAGAMEEETYRHLLQEAGFVDINLEVTRRYSLQDIADSGGSNSLSRLSEDERTGLEGKFVSAFIRARKPA